MLKRWYLAENIGFQISGKVLAAARGRKYLTQSDLASRVGGGMTARLVGRLEHNAHVRVCGVNIISGKMLWRFARALGVRMDQLSRGGVKL